MSSFTFMNNYLLYYLFYKNIILLINNALTRTKAKIKKQSEVNKTDSDRSQAEVFDLRAYQLKRSVTEIPETMVGLAI